MFSRYAITIDGTVVVSADINLKTYELVSLFTHTDFRRRGLGRRMMKLVCDEADRSGIKLDLMAAGDPSAMTTKQLEAWYARFGFVLRPNCMMVRQPRTQRK